MALFQTATKLKLRFKTAKGWISTEDVWDLPLTQLDTLAKHLRREVQENNMESFIKPAKRDESTRSTELCFELVKKIITVRLAEMDEAEQRVAKRQKREQILELIEAKKHDSLKESSIEELTALLNDL